MPLSTGALWPTLRPLGTASAEDMTSKFEWLEGNIYPQTGGIMTTGSHKIGNTSYLWKNGYFNNVSVGDGVLNASNTTGDFIKMFANVTHTYNTITTNDSYNVSAITLDLVTAQTTKIFAIDTMTSFEGCAVGSYIGAGNLFVRFVIGWDGTTGTAYYVQKQITEKLGNYTTGSFSVMVMRK
jgi:hypothetical protein